MANKTCFWQVDTLCLAQDGPYSIEALDKLIMAEIVARQFVHGFLYINQEVRLCSRIDYQIHTCIVGVQNMHLYAVLGMVYCQHASTG